MAKQTINLGTAPTGAGGDTNRGAFAKCQANDDELYASVATINTTIATTNSNVTTAQADITGLKAGTNILHTINAKGESIRFPDGTQINFGRQVINATVNAGTTVAWDAFLAVNQPMPFMDNKSQSSVVITFMTAANAGGEPLYSSAHYYDSNGAPALAFMNMGTKPSQAFPSFNIGTFAALSYTVNFKTVGRWK